ncbi:hypothetical protein G9C85_09330 [Halorubellus sp. JP-L1]|uniref:hypothetical protein n=1 Tax=Halorubellus sp. JP-L1 TaxID=2715753 RepID=UPI00140DD82D|nr:hypothetical protein [Halorubellus sp. JP-L1]NHN41830.1 hypothetical protein [Halorubellus sp. JP-L1]
MSVNQQQNLDQSHLPRIKPHARTRWAERTPADRPLEVAWRQAQPVDAPAARCSYARLYQPYDALFIVRDGWLRTVLHNDGRLEKDGLVLCTTCDDLIDPIMHDTCPTCDAEQPASQTSGRITITRRGGDR